VESLKAAAAETVGASGNLGSTGVVTGATAATALGASVDGAPDMDVLPQHAGAGRGVIREHSVGFTESSSK